MTRCSCKTCAAWAEAFAAWAEAFAELSMNSGSQIVTENVTASSPNLAQLAGGQMDENQTRSQQPFDVVERPKHYNSHPSGIECIEVTEHFGFNLGNAIKYIWRCDEKADEIEDLRKARWYIEREISLRERARAKESGK